MKNSVSRRSFFRVGMGAMGTLAAGQALAQVCGVITGEQPLGPFFPRPNTPEDSIREDQDPTTPIFLANDSDLTVVKGRVGTAKGQVVYVKGKVLDEACRPVPDATLIIWQASGSGRYNHKGDAGNPDFIHPETGEVIQRTLDPSFQYWGKAVTNSLGEYQFKTIVPGFYPADLQNAWYRPSHIHFMVTATGFPQFVTQMYFRGDKLLDNEWVQKLNEKDFLLQSSSITNEQREKLVVLFEEDPSKILTDGLVGEFDITLKR